MTQYPALEWVEIGHWSRIECAAKHDPQWTDLAILSGLFDLQVDVAAASGVEAAFRHRKRSFDGQDVNPWVPGRPPVTVA